MAALVVKADGTSEPFEVQKLIDSLHRSGADKRMAEQVAHEIESELFDGVSTQEIYSRAFARLRDIRHPLAARYSLKRAVLDFGPSGFPFEAYLGELFRAEGFKAEVGVLVRGACVEHEVDVIIKDKDSTTYAEAKFHNAAGFKTDLKTVLYVQARIDDIAAAKKGEGRTKGLVITNTKFTSKAIEYASCKGLELIGWDYPQGRTLHDRIEAAGLYPITALTTLTNREKTALLGQRMVLCNALPQDGDALLKAGVTGARADAVLEEVGALCVPGKAV